MKTQSSIKDMFGSQKVLGKEIKKNDFLTISFITKNTKKEVKYK